MTLFKRIMLEEEGAAGFEYSLIIAMVALIAANIAMVICGQMNSGLHFSR